jgi:BirA family biotin operon repressor/biotin-[acetyl-CoA-carboxylase] ligase
MLIDKIKNDTDMFKIMHKKIVDSTNNWAKRENITNTIFIADYQSEGRGRFNRVWESPENKNLYFSIKMEIKNYMEGIHYNFMASLAIAKTLNDLYGFIVTIKWPNDLLIKNKKFSGILSEIDNSKKLSIIIGIGINCFFDTKVNSLSNVATSLHYYIKNLDKEFLFKKILETFYKLNKEYKQKEFKYILKNWNKYAKIENRLLYTTISNKKEMVRVIKLNNDGSIMVERADGSVIKLIAGDIEYAKESDN